MRQPLLESMPSGVLLVDDAGNIAYANQRLARMFGYDPPELLGQPVEKLVPERFRDAHAVDRRNFLKAPTIREMGSRRELTGLRKDNDEFTVEIGLGPLATPRGTFVIAVVNDLSRRHLAEHERGSRPPHPEREKRWLQALVERAPVGIILIEDAQGERIEANRRADVFFGHPLTPEGGVAQLVGRMCRADGAACLIDELPCTRALRGEVVNGEEMLLSRLDGRQAAVLVNAGPIRDATGRVVGAILVIDDLTPVKQLERLRQEWMSIIAHDLRQPVTVILGYAGQLVRRNREDRGDPQRALDHILASGRQMSRMVNDLLDVSRLEARRLSLEWQLVDLAALVTAVAERMAEVTSGHAIRVSITEESLPTIRADPSRIEQVLGNLLSNAAKYGFADTDIDLVVRRNRYEVVVAVTNRGDGIPPDELPSLFSRFHRPPQIKARGIAGLGLGLYITKGLIEAHGGRIWVESVPGQQTTFSFALPIGAAESGEAADDG